MSYTTRLSSSALAMRVLLVAALVLSIALGPWGTGSAHAMDDQPGHGTVQLSGPPQHQQEERSDPEANLPYLFAVYIITWAGFFGYVFYVSRRQRQLHREIDDLRQALAEKERLSTQPAQEA